MGGPAVSVIIPAYNREGTIARALDSVLAQTLTDLELIVVDDASTDRTAEVVAAYADPRVRLLRHATNRRAAAARNTGIRAALGRYVAFLDSDDEWLPEKLAVQIAALDAAPPDVAASCTGYLIVDGAELFARTPTLVSYRQIFMGCDLSPGSTLVVRRDIYADVGLNDETLYRYEDWDWVLRYAQRYRMGVVPAYLARVYRGPRPPAAPMAQATERFLAKHAAELATFGPVYRRKIKALRRFELAELYFRDRDLGAGTACLLKALGTWPLVRPGMYVLLVDALFGIPLQRALWRLFRRPGAGPPVNRRA
ncbi:MAG: glycosyltransferase family 2 protein [Nitrospirae bacterium]|nr:glycosyltransferase family 2 protein [Nitrospirota bacterium]